MKLTIKITKEVLRQSMNCKGGPEGSCENAKDFEKQKGIGFNCAIGTAVCRIFPRAWVSPHSIWIYDTYQQFYAGRASFSMSLPTEAQNFIQVFDKCKPEERPNLPEMSFEIEVPDELINRIGIDQVHAILKESKTLSIASLC